ncbi:hypothetical protein SAMN06272789_6743 [Streptomyces sp. 1331.2]|nr:hypothetical protein SAMN06272789_6743 [Streptomyces sp. 1331.2]
MVYKPLWNTPYEVDGQAQQVWGREVRADEGPKREPARHPTIGGNQMSRPEAGEPGTAHRVYAGRAGRITAVHRP